MADAQLEAKINTDEYLKDHKAAILKTNSDCFDCTKGHSHFQDKNSLALIPEVKKIPGEVAYLSRQILS